MLPWERQSMRCKLRYWTCSFIQSRLLHTTHVDFTVTAYNYWKNQSPKQISGV